MVIGNRIKETKGWSLCQVRIIKVKNRIKRTSYGALSEKLRETEKFNSEAICIKLQNIEKLVKHVYLRLFNIQ